MLNIQLESIQKSRVGSQACRVGQGGGQSGVLVQVGAHMWVLGAGCPSPRGIGAVTTSPAWRQGSAPEGPGDRHQETAPEGTQYQEMSTRGDTESWDEHPRGQSIRG